MKKNLNKLYIVLIYILILIVPIKVDAAGILLNKNETLIGPGYTETLKYTIDEELNSSNIVWTSSNEKVATVDAKGKVQALTPGYTIITASINGKSSTCKVIVNSNYIPVEQITLNKSDLSLVVGAKETLTKTIRPSNATNQDVSWHSSDSSVATVSSAGEIIAKKVGTTIITVSSPTYQATCKVTVIDTVELKKINFNKINLTIKEKETDKLSITFNPSNATNKKVTWKSSNINVATVNNQGLITAIKPGTVTITAVSNDGGHVATCKVTVEAISKKVTSVTLNKKELNLIAGTQETLIATIKPDYAENKKVTWTSSDEKVAIVENGIVKALAPGVTEIKVISENENKEAICKVTVTAPPIKEIKFSKEKQTIYIDSEITLKPILTPENSVLEKAIWTSSDESVATVENGKVKAINLGETTITVSTEDNKVSASITIVVVAKPKEKLEITIENYGLNFNPNIKNYKLTIADESELIINTNRPKSKVTINGNKNLKKGSIITITVTDDEKVTYIIEIDKKQNYTIYFIAIISVLLLLNLIRLMIQNKKKKY